MTEEHDVYNTPEAEKEVSVQEPKRYSIIFHNDDFTPFDFVISVLMQFFGYTEEDAIAMASGIHNNGKGIVQSNLTKDVAETKVQNVGKIATNYEYPLKAEAQPTSD